MTVTKSKGTLGHYVISLLTSYPDRSPLNASLLTVISNSQAITVLKKIDSTSVDHRRSVLTTNTHDFVTAIRHVIIKIMTLGFDLPDK